MRKITVFFAVLFLSTISVVTHAQVKGKVTDSKDGTPIAGASVKIKGTHTGVSTNTDGTFELNAKPGATLAISSTGYEAKDLKATAEMQITLAKDIQGLTEVVVTALGIRRQPKELGYSTAKISGQDLEQTRPTNITTGLAAKASGVDIRLADNGINPNVKIQFRGARSITGNNTALIIVDGIPVEQNYLATLNPDDVESSTILKGANAAALYGIEASNGVLVITTKHAQKSKVSFNYRSTFATERISYFPALQTEYSGYGGEGTALNPLTGATISYVDPLTGMPLSVPFENQSFGPAYNSLDFPMSQIAIGGPNPADSSIKYAPYTGLKNGRTSFFQTGLDFQNDLSANIGTKWGGFYVSGQNVTNSGVVPKDTYNRNSIKISGNGDFGKLSVTGGFDYSNSKTSQTSGSYFQDRQVYWNVINQPAQMNLGAENHPNSDFFASPSGFVNAYYQNPWWQVYNSRQNVNDNNMIANLQLSYKILDWLSATARSGYSSTKSNGSAYIDSVTFSSFNGNYDPWGASNTASGFYNATTGASKSPFQNETLIRKWDDWNTDAYLTAKRKWNKFNGTLVAGFNTRYKTSSVNWYSNQTSVYNTISSNGYHKVTNSDGSANVQEQFKANSQSVYADATVGYDGWVFVHGSIRNDWVSILDPQDRSFYYPGLDAAAVLSDKFPSIKKSGIVSFLKVNAGVAKTGNVNIPQYKGYGDNMWNGGNGVSLPTFGAYGIYPIVSAGTGFPYGNVTGNTLSTQLVQPHLKPETGTNFEVGAEVGFLHDRINFKVTGYSEKIINETINLSTASSSGAGNYLSNAATVLNRGLEFDLNLNPLIKVGKFKWNLGGNLSLVDNKVISLANGLSEIQLQSFSSLASSAYVWAGGVYAEVGQAFPVIKVADFVRDPLGRVIVDSKTGNPTPSNTTHVVGNTAYKQFLGLNTNLSYGKFSLSAVVDYRGGAKILNALGNALDNTGIGANTAQSRSRFVVPNSVYAVANSTYPNGPVGYVPNTNVPISNAYGGDDSYWSTLYAAIGQPFVTSAAFWKLRELVLSYDIGKIGNGKVIKKIGVSVFGRNLFMWRPSTNQWTDPEFSNSGTGNAVGVNTENQTPPTRVIGCSLNIGF